MIDSNSCQMLLSSNNQKEHNLAVGSGSDIHHELGGKVRQVVVPTAKRCDEQSGTEVLVKNQVEES